MSDVKFTVQQPAPASNGAVTTSSTKKGGDDACTNAAPSATVCTCATATFITDGVVAGDKVENTTTGYSAIVVTVDSETQLTTSAITSLYTATDTIQVYEQGWDADTYSIKVVALYDGETDFDNMGVARTVTAAWNNINVGLNDTMDIPISIDTSRAFSLAVYFQSGAAFSLTAAASKIADADITVVQNSATTYTITAQKNDVVSSSITFGATATTLELSAPATMTFTGTEQTVRDAWGDVIQKANVTNRGIDTVTINYSTVLSIPTNGLATLHNWKKNQVYLKLENTSGATSPLLPVTGVISSLTQLDTRTQNDIESIYFVVDVEDL